MRDAGCRKRVGSPRIGVGRWFAATPRPPAVRPGGRLRRPANRLRTGIDRLRGDSRSHNLRTAPIGRTTRRARGRTTRRARANNAARSGPDAGSRRRLRLRPRDPADASDVPPTGSGQASTGSAAIPGHTTRARHRSGGQRGDLEGPDNAARSRGRKRGDLDGSARRRLRLRPCDPADASDVPPTGSVQASTGAAAIPGHTTCARHRAGGQRDALDGRTTRRAQAAGQRGSA